MKKVTFVRLFGICTLLLTAGLWSQTNQPEQSLNWRSVQELAKDTVVQVFVQTSVFNWLEPFKSPDMKKSVGSGFFIDAEGHILSNFHVIEEACGIKVQIPAFGKEQFEVSIVGVCPDRDLALLKLSKRARTKIQSKLGRIPYLELGNSDEIVRTQEILALGYPLGQEKLKSTQGIVSGREIAWGESYIQITAALNPGNSGGPSIDSKGKVIGINTARVKAAQGIGYIIPINDVKSVVDGLHTIKLLRSPILGGEYNYATSLMTKYLNNPAPGGMYISRVYKDTLFDRNNIKEGDMIYSINGYQLDLYGESNVGWNEDKVPVVAILNRFALGQQINIVIYRNGQKHEVSFAYEHLNLLPIRTFYPPHESIDYEIIGGMVLMQLTLNHIEKFEEINPAIATDLAIYEKRQHQYKSRIIVTHVFPTSQTQEARSIGIGDIIKEVDGKAVHTLEQLRSIIQTKAQDPTSEGIISCKAKDKKFLVLSFDRIISDERRLSARYGYKKTNLVKEIKKRFKMQTIKSRELGDE